MSVQVIIEVKKWILAVPDYATLAYNYDTSEMLIYGAEGDSPESAIIIRGVLTHGAGVKAEYYWIKRRYPGYKRVSKKTSAYPKDSISMKKIILIDGETGVKVEVAPPKVTYGMYDVLIIKNSYGFKKEIYFDITNFINIGEDMSSNKDNIAPSLNDFFKEVEKERLKVDSE